MGGVIPNNHTPPPNPHTLLPGGEMPDWPVGVDTSAMAENYARYLVPTVLSVWTVDTLQHVQPRPGDTVLDVACGTGAVTFDVAQLVGPLGRVVGVDTDSAMLAIAERIRKARGMNNVSVRDMDSQALKFADGVFDRVICQHALMFFEDKVKAVKEMYRVLSRGGRMVITVWGTRAGTPHENLLAEVFRDIFEDEPPFFETLFSVGERGDMEAILREAGIKANAIVERVHRQVIFPSAESYWQGVIYGRPLATILDPLPEPTRAAMKAEAITKLRPYKDQARYMCPMDGVIVTITKP